MLKGRDVIVQYIEELEKTCVFYVGALQCIYLKNVNHSAGIVSNQKVGLANTESRFGTWRLYDVIAGMMT